MAPTLEPNAPVETLDEVIASYLLTVVKGQSPNRQDLIERHPSLAQALTNFFANFDRMDRIASPLRKLSEWEAMGTVDADDSASMPFIRDFGGYELLEQIAHGGMGVVYKARDVALNRIVALKMVLAGAFASQRDVERFRAEAEAVAILDHPHIVPIYEVGTHEGQEYFSMKFIEGSTLAQLPRGRARAEVAGLLDVVQAVHHAHQHGVLHRDLKPSNVLVDAQGTRYVTDFGLAKRLTGSHHTLTETALAIGTPRYMAPEQAEGQKDLTVTADVYSLGVILYERLTGRTPFTGENALIILRQVREQEPPRPSSIQPGLERDLETIVLKCLDREPARRYSSAQALASDLTNWLERRPISARPVGQGERAWRWCRRNPLVAGLAASLILALVLGTVISGLFAIEASHRAHDATLARNEMERTFARSLVMPLDIDGETKETLSEAEIETLWELATNRDDSLRLRFLEEATRDPITAAKLRARSESAMIAVVGLDTKKRQQADRILVSRRLDTKLSLTQQADIALVRAELEESSGPTVSGWVPVLIKAIHSNPLRATSLRWGTHIQTLLARMNPNSTEEVLLGIWDSRFRAYPLGKGLYTDIGDIAARIDRDKLRNTIEQIADRLSESNDASSCFDISCLLVTLEFPLTTDQVTRINRRPAQALAETITRSSDLKTWQWATAGLALVTQRMSNAESAKICLPVAHFMVSRLATKQLDMETVRLFANILGQIYARIDQAKAAELSGRAARTIAEFLTPELEPNESDQILTGLKSLAPHMTRDEAAVVCSQVGRVLVSRLKRSAQVRQWEIDPRTVVSSQILDVATWMEHSEAERTYHIVAKFLIDSIEHEASGKARAALAVALSRVAAKMDPNDASSICTPWLQLIAESIDSTKDQKDNKRKESLQFLNQLLTTIISRFNPAQAVRELTTALQGQSGTTTRPGSQPIASLIARHIDPKTATPLLLESLEREKNPGFRNQAVSILSAVSSRLDSSEKIRIHHQAARLMAAELKKASDVQSQREYAKGLVTTTKEIDSVTASRLLSVALERQLDPECRVALALGLSSVAEQMPAEQATQVLLEALGQASNLPGRGELYLGLGAVGRQASARVAAQASEVLLKMLPHESDATIRRTVVDVILAMASRLSPEEATHTCLKAIRILCHLANQVDPEFVPAYDLETNVVRFLPCLGPEIAHTFAWEIAARTCSTTAATNRLFQPQQYPTDLMDSLLTDTNPQRSEAKSIAPPGPDPVKLPKKGSQRSIEPGHCRLTSQELIELLKMPTCFGPVRRKVLSHLGKLHGRDFANHWDIVRFAQEKGLKLDFATPPRRPDAKKSLPEILDGICVN